MRSGRNERLNLKTAVPCDGDGSSEFGMGFVVAVSKIFPIIEWIIETRGIEKTMQSRSGRTTTKATEQQTTMGKD